MTSNEDNEILEILEIIKNTTAETYHMHESFNANK